MNRDSPGRSNKPRITLGDLTNQLGKRGFSLVSRGPPPKSGLGNARNANKENVSQSTKRISLGGNDSVAETLGAKCPNVANSDKPFPLLKGGKTYRLLSLGNPDSVSDSKRKTENPLSSAEGGFGLLGIKESGGSGGYSQSVSGSSKHGVEIGGKSQDPEQKDECQAAQTEPLIETLGSQTASTDDGKDSGSSSVQCNDNLPFVGSRLTISQGTKPFELDRCMWLKGDAASSAAAGADSLKACSCSFCIKAAYMWSDLHYMDVKGRMSALMKSKRDASNLVKMYSVDNGVGGGQGSSSNSPPQLEIDLMNRCKSLFVCMEDTFGKECSQLETEMSSIKDIRENFKMSLGATDEMPLDVQNCDSDASAGQNIT